MASMRSDGRAVDVTLSSTVSKDDYVVVEGFHGVAMQDGVSGETIALEIAQREHELTVPGGVTAAKGDVLYITSAGTVTNTASGNTPFLKVTLAKDDNNVVWGIQLPQA